MGRKCNEFFKKEIAGITILAPARSHIQKIGKSLDFLHKQGLIEKVQQINYILILPLKGYDNVAQEVNIYGKRSIIWIGRRNIVLQNNIVYFSSLIVHEAHHAFLKNIGKKWTGRTAETEALNIQIEFLKKYGTEDHVEYLSNCNKKWWYQTKENIMRDTTHYKYLQLFQSNELVITKL